ncbi:MAG: metal-dependent hydrolase [Pseudomonadota bacterium]
MDPLTHALTGAAIAAALVPEGQQRRMALAGAVVAVAPDVDIFLGSAADPLVALELHRHFTHSLVFAPVLAAIGAALATFWCALSWRRATLVLLPAALSAGLLDACTSYGTHLLWPFTDARTAWSVVAVLDPVITLIMAVSLVVTLVGTRATAAVAGLTLACAYLLAGAVQHERAAWAVRSLADTRGHDMERVVVKPTLANLLLWRTMYESAGTLHVAAIRVGWPGDVTVYPGDAAEMLAPADTGLPAASTGYLDIERFARLADGFLIRHPSRENVVGDARFAMQPDRLSPMFAIEVNPARPQQHVRYVELRERPADAWKRFKAMLAGIPLPAPVNGRADTI